MNAVVSKNPEKKNHGFHKKKKKHSWAENQGIGMIPGWSCAFEDRSYAQW